MKNTRYLLLICFLSQTLSLKAQNQVQTWTGTTDSIFSTPGNWNSGGAPLNPDCHIDVIIPPVATSPSLTTDQWVGRVEILPGATLRVLGSTNVYVCGSFSNLGTLIVEDGATVHFTDTATQHVSGVLDGGGSSVNSFYNFVSVKTSGNVFLDDNIRIRKDFSSLTGGSTFDINGKTIDVGGGFYVANGTTAFSAINGSTVMFTGDSNQTITNAGGDLRIDSVIINKPAGRLFLNSVSSPLYIGAKLSLLSGIVVSDNAEVFIENNDTSAVTPGNMYSFVSGRLRRKIYSGSPLSLPATYNFPVGDSTTGFYELLTVKFKSTVTVPTLVASFNRVGFPSVGPVANECDNTYDQAVALDHGYWKVLQDTGIVGLFEMGLHNFAYTNNLGGYWTVMVQDTLNDPPLQGAWQLEGVCEPGSTNILTLRDSMTSFNRYFATAQGTVQYTGLSEPGKLQCGIHPNMIAKGSTTRLRLDADTNEEVTIAFFNVQGQLLMEHSLKIESGENNIELDTTGMPSGIYFLKMKSNRLQLPTLRLVVK